VILIRIADTIRALIDRLHCERPLTVVVASHRFESLERTCERVALLDGLRHPTFVG
jgi:ABC-type multidrug transport system ATPase subunit